MINCLDGRPFNRSKSKKSFIDELGFLYESREGYETRTKIQNFKNMYL